MGIHLQVHLRIVEDTNLNNLEIIDICLFFWLNRVTQFHKATYFTHA